MELSHHRSAGNALASGAQRSAKHAAALVPPIHAFHSLPTRNVIGQVNVLAAVMLWGQLRAALLLV